VYVQSTGELWRGAELAGRGYSGAGDAKNRPECQDQHGRGPIPCGWWRMGPAIHHAHLGPLSIPLAPCEGTQTFGRSAFFCHGDSLSAPGTASEGCVIMPHDVRAALAASPDRILEVVAVRLAQEVA